MRKGWVRASLVLSAAGAIVLATGTAAYAQTVTAANDAASTTVGTAVTINVTANDSIETGATAVTVSAPSATTNGANAVSGLNIVYTPNAGFTGSDSFTYELCGTFPSGSYGGGDTRVCDTATVTVNVDAAGVGGQGTPPPTQPYGGGDVQGQGTGSGGSLPFTGTSGAMMVLLAVALLGGGAACYGASRDRRKTFVR
jgi:Big-like domain-containing protein